MKIDAFLNEAKCSAYASICFGCFSGNVFAVIFVSSVLCSLKNPDAKLVKSYGTLKCFYLAGILFFIAEIVILIGVFYHIIVEASIKNITNIFGLFIIITGFLSLRSCFNSFSKVLESIPLS